MTLFYLIVLYVHKKGKGYYSFSAISFPPDPWGGGGEGNEHKLRKIFTEFNKTRVTILSLCAMHICCADKYSFLVVSWYILLYFQFVLKLSGTKTKNRK